MTQDIRQSPEWTNFMQAIGWEVVKLANINTFIKKIPCAPVSLVKILRPPWPIPFAAIDELARKRRALFVKIQPDLLNQDTISEIFTKNGYQRDSWPTIPTKTIQHDLTPSEEVLYRKLSKDARQSIRKAEEYGY